MDTSVPKQMIDLIRAERQRRALMALQLADENSDLASDVWQFRDEPLVNELCLILLVAVWHQVEREVISLAARVTSDGKQITREQYLGNLDRTEGEWRYKRSRGKVIRKLDLDRFPKWESSIKTLNLLANCYKHDSTKTPGTMLLEHLRLDVTQRCMPLHESSYLRKGLAASVGLPEGAAFCDIAEELLASAATFLVEIQTAAEQTGRLSTWGPVDFGDPGFYAG
jgi:hypothetical protein